MISGVVTAEREAVVRLQVLDVNGQPIVVDAVIDTGFNGYLTLPAAIVTSLSLPLHGTRAAMLGDGSNVMLDIYRAQVMWHDQPRTVQILAAEGGALVGMSLLHGSELRMRVATGGSVTIESLT